VPDHVLGGLKAGSLVIDMSSSAPVGTQALGAELAEARIRLVDAPVSGGVKRAVDGSLAIMAGGAAADVEAARPILAAMGKQIFLTGPLGSGHAMKALNNYVSAAGLAAAAEAVMVGERFGLASDTVVDILNASTGRNNATDNKLKQFILSRSFGSGFSLGLMAKDLRIALATAEATHTPTPLGAACVALWNAAERALGGAADHTEIARYLRDPGRGDAMTAEQVPGTDADTYEVFAVKYAQHERRASANFLGGDPHDGPMPLDYFVWLVRGNQAQLRRRSRLPMPPKPLCANASICASRPTRCACSASTRGGRGRRHHPSPLRSRRHLRRLSQGDASSPGQGDGICHRPPHGAQGVPRGLCGRGRRRAGARGLQGRVRFHDGDAELAPGVSVHHIGGHTKGLQVVRVRTRRGWVVLASDAAHLYANMDETRPFPIIYHLGEMVDGYRRLAELADSRAHIIPGHDPLVMRRYPPPSPELEGICVRLDVPPRE